MDRDAFIQRLFSASQSGSRRRRKDKRGGCPPRFKAARGINVEALEDRRMLAVFYVANPSSYQVTADTAPPGLSNGDTVTWAGGGQFNSVANLTYGTNAFTSINAAIAAASNGDTIDVAPGAYDERVNVNKGLTLDGAQLGVDARGGRGAAANEAIVDGQDLGGGRRSTAFYVTANDATIDGFTVQNTNDPNVFGAGIDLGAGISGAHVVNDIVQNNIIGLFLSNASGADQTVVQHDLFQNNNQAGPASGNGIYSDQFTAGGALTNVLIDGNAFAGNANAGLNLGSSQAGSQSNLAISNNTFTNNGNAVDLFDTTSSSLTGNTISGSTGSQIFLGGGVDGLQIADNVVQNGQSKGIDIGPDVGGYPNPNANITINDNSISGNAGLALSIDAGRYTGTLDGRENWWGTNDATVIQSQISGPVAFSPYLDDGSNGISSGPGFQGDASHLDVTSAGAQIGAVGAIQAAVDAAPVGGTVTIQAGTYTEGDVVIDKNLTLQASGAVTLAAPTAGSGTGITITGNPQNVTIAGFTIGDFASSLSSNGGDTLNLIDLTLNNTIFPLGPPFPPVTNSPISNVSNLNLTATPGSRNVGIGADGQIRFFDGNDSIALTNVSHLSATTGAGSDTFFVAPLASTSITIDAGNPTPPASPGDALNLNLSGATGASLSVANSPQGFSGSWTFNNRQPVNFSHIETLSPATVTSQGNQTINATESVNTGPVVVATFTDPSGPGPLSNYSADIQWGDGATSTGTVTFDSASGTFFVIGSHTYAEDGSQTLTVTVHRLGGPDVVINGTAIVAEPAISFGALPAHPMPGVEFSPLTNITLNSFTHGNNSEPASNFSAVINWGDGTTSPGTVSQGSQAGSAYAVAASHTYRDEGYYLISVAVSDDTASATNTIAAAISEEALPNGSTNGPIERFVSEVYRDLLHRAVDPAGLAFWSAGITAGEAKADVATAIQNSDEYRGIEVNALYQTYLHRDSEAAALAADIQLLAHGETNEQLAASLASSDEYFQSRAGGTNDGFLGALFQDALHRAIDAGSKTFFQQALAHGGTRAQVADLVFGSHEYHAEVVQNLYLQTLDRGADAAGIDYWANQLDHGQHDEQIRAAIMGSTEYFDKTAAGGAD